MLTILVVGTLWLLSGVIAFLFALTSSENEFWGVGGCEDELKLFPLFIITGPIFLAAVLIIVLTEKDGIKTALGIKRKRVSYVHDPRRGKPVLPFTILWNYTSKEELERYNEEYHRAKKLVDEL